MPILALRGNTRTRGLGKAIAAIPCMESLRPKRSYEIRTSLPCDCVSDFSSASIEQSHRFYWRRGISEPTAHSDEARIGNCFNFIKRAFTRGQRALQQR